MSTHTLSMGSSLIGLQSGFFDCSNPNFTGPLLFVCISNQTQNVCFMQTQIIANLIIYTNHLYYQINVCISCNHRSSQFNQKLGKFLYQVINLLQSIPIEKFCKLYNTKRLHFLIKRFIIKRNHEHGVI